MEGIVDKWWREIMHISSTSIRLGKLKERISRAICGFDFDNSYTENEIERIKDALCEIRQKILGKEFTDKIGDSR